MEFREFHNFYFNTQSGAFSRVTDREFIDSQITITDAEAEILIQNLGFENIQNGNVRSNPVKASTRFLLYPKMTPISLNLVFPKPGKLELRLYLKQRVFKPSGGDIWFVYVNGQNDLVLGALPELVWHSLGQADTEDDWYQNSIEESLVAAPRRNLNINPDGRILTNNVEGRTIYVRDPRLAIMRFETTGYTCEIDPSHRTFTAQKTNRQFMEAHHFIPMQFQPIFDKPLDNFTNVTSVCPNCHRAIHYGVVEKKLELVSALYEKRPELHYYPFDYIAQFYNSIRLPAE